MKEKPARKPFVPPSSREEEIFSRLQEAEDKLAYAADVDHYCEDPKCTPENPQCRDRHVEAALVDIRRLLDPPHISLHPKRQSNDAERIYAERWRKENVRQPAINHGFTALEWILCPDGQRLPERATLRDAVVAASVIQWLGTNCGHGFVLQAEKEIEVARARHSKWRQLEHRADYDPQAKPSPEIAAEAEQVVGKLWSVLPPEEEKLRAAMQKLVAAALQSAEARGAASARDAILAALAPGPPVQPVESRQ